AQRGLLVSLNEVAITVGFLLAYTVNYAFISRPNGCTCPALLQLVGTMFLPQSPHYLMLKGRNDKARKVLQLIHGEEAGVVEMQHMQKSLGQNRCHRVSSLQNQRYRDLVSPSLRGRMLVGMGLVFLQQFTGQTNVVYYAPTLLKHLGFCTNVAATLASVGLGVVK
ncbi:facilitated glucose transporter, putative, partial [Ixodes scapularis]